MSAAQWALWLAIAALVAASGKFIDDYHIKSTTKSKYRDILIKLFIWIEAHKIPDFGGFLFRAIHNLFRIRRFIIVIL